MTAVQWLEKQYLLTNGKLVCQDFEYAEKLEKQQIMNTYIIADSESTQEDSEHNALKFYERTYGSKGSDEVLKCTCNVDSFLCQIHGTSDGKTITAF